MVESGALPRETRNYVPRFAAALEIVRAPERHGFAQPLRAPVRYDVVRVRHSLTLATVASMAGRPLAAIAELNPSLIRGVTPPDARGYVLRVPRGSGERFQAAYARMTRGVVS
jgi:membrane-bound lytic murein transglycosylase D